METEESSDRKHNCPALTEINAIVIGSKLEYKCSAANTILGHKHWEVGNEIVKSEMKQGVVQNRKVNLVMTPGWWKSSTLAESTKYIQMEIVHSLKLCPAPHAFLLVINLHKPFTGVHLNNVLEHMEILGKQIWNHTILLLMYHNKTQRHANSKQLIERAGTEIKTVIKKCGNRVHVFSYTDSKEINVEKLFQEIENLVAEHEGQCFKIDSKLLENMEEKRRTVKERAEERVIQAKTKMLNLNQSLTEKSCNFPELRIVLMGSNAVGKTSVMNTIHNMKMTQEKSRTKECEMSVREIDKRKVILIDTPGWWPYASEQETPESVKQEIMSSVTMCSPGPHAVLLVLQSGVAFTEAHRRSVKEHMELLGRSVWKYSIVVFTRGDWMGTPTIEEHIESEGKALQWLIDKCGNRYHVLNNVQQDDGTQVRELMEKVKIMARLNTVLPVAVGEALEEMEDKDEEEANMRVEEQAECRSFFEGRPLLDEAYIDKWRNDFHHVSNYGTMSELSEIEHQTYGKTKGSETMRHISPKELN
ncbi:uncharacterized protein LOC113119862 [Carassius auratus]|uniref:Uncharacterized protein LOC113119862 n=1 Tax=Carassius auratus TaxID=7957 RepID=A0A6P6RI16_CARAU|nr:uncharacterized protein LOC113119862 [Carassius auratus]